MRFPGMKFIQFAVATASLSACTGSIAGSNGSSASSGGKGGDSGPVAGGGGEGGIPGQGGTGSTSVNDTSFTCDETATSKSPAWRRLTRAEYENSARDLLNLALGDATLGGQAYDDAKVSWNALPSEARQVVSIDIHGTTRRMDQAVSGEHAMIWYQGAVALGKALTTPSRIGRALGVCATDANAANDAKCLADFVNRFGERVLRRPLVAADTEFYLGFYGATPGVDPAGVADVVGGLFAAPDFLYHIVNGGESTGRKSEYALTAFELASRLSYHFWATTPDDALWTAAKNGSLSDAAGLETQVARMLQDPRSRASLREFYRDWLKLDDQKVIDPSKATAQFKAFAGVDMPKGDLRTGIIDDTLDLLSHYTWDKPAGVSAALTSNLSFARSADLAKLYGIAPWSGTGAPPEFPAGERPGLLTRAAFLVTGSAASRPIVKGVFIRQNILCDSIPPPPANAQNVDTKPLQARVLSARQFVEAVTENDGTECKTCHSVLINPLGFATENYDALGRRRTEEKVLADDGTERGVVPVNTRVVPNIILDDARETDGPAELATALVESGKPDACVARQYFRFAFTRLEDDAADGCVLERLRTTLASGTLADGLKEVALTPDFSSRLFP
jgi:Protein of unknown function (DUF1592)/Protein of unknown function (DUF1588)/Protein of unknown function (DUF1595)